MQQAAHWLWLPMQSSRHMNIKEGENVVGIDADIAAAVADKLGMELKIEDMAFDSIIPAVTSGKADIGLAGMTVTEDRLEKCGFL